MKKKISVLLVLGMMGISGLVASAYSYETLFTQLTGVPGYGTVRAFMTHRTRSIYVTAQGKWTSRGYARPWKEASAQSDRAWSGNKTWWNYQ